MEGRFPFSNILNQSIYSYSQKTVDPVMTAYKLVTIQFKWWEQLFQCQSVANNCCIWNDEMQNCFNMWPTIKVCSMSKMPVSILRAGDVDVDGVWCQFLIRWVYKCHKWWFSGGDCRTELKTSSTPRSDDFSQTSTDRLKLETNQINQKENKRILTSGNFSQTVIQTVKESLKLCLCQMKMKQVFCWMDRYHGMTMDDIRALEEATKKELDEERGKGEIRGTAGLE